MSEMSPEELCIFQTIKLYCSCFAEMLVVRCQVYNQTCHKFFLAVGPLSFPGSKTKKFPPCNASLQECVCAFTVSAGTFPEHFMRTRRRNNRAKLQKKERNQRIAPSFDLLILPPVFFPISLQCWNSK